MTAFLARIPEGSLKGVKVASVDTRLKTKWVKIFSYAAEKMAVRLAKCGGSPAAFPEVLVKGSKGPLLDQELERASAWAKAIASAK
jgi:hypothetical protein